jgi:toxin ParE1/3/4
MKVEFHPEAEMELIEAAAYYEAKVPGLGQRLANDARAAIEILSHHPEIGAVVGGGLRRLTLRNFPFSLIYAISPATLQILAVAHQSRLPGYWRRRGGP